MNVGYYWTDASSYLYVSIGTLDLEITEVYFWQEFRLWYLHPKKAFDLKKPRKTEDMTTFTHFKINGLELTNLIFYEGKNK